MRTGVRLAAAATLLAGCAAPPSPAPPAPGPAPVSDRPESAQPEQRGSLPPVPAVRGALRIDLVYPAEGAALTTRASNFVFGSTGTGLATLRINGQEVPVAPNGAFLAFLPVPSDGIYQAEAAVGSERTALTRRIQPPAAAARAAIDTASISPRGAMTVMAGERIPVRFRGEPGASARLLLPGGEVVTLVETPVEERADGFGQDRDPAQRVTEYRGDLEATPLHAPGTPAPTVGTLPLETAGARIEVVAGDRVTTVPLPLSLAVLPAGRVRMATVASPRPDGNLLAAAVPGGGAPLGWSLPNGTRVAVSGERDGAARVQLTPDLAVWADPRALRLDPTDSPPPAGAVASVRVIPTAESLDVRFATSTRMPFRVFAEGNALVVEIYGARSRTNWLYLGAEDPYLRTASWDQPRDDVYRVRLELSRPPWGWRAAWDESGALTLRIRRAPRIDQAHPLAGIHVALDAGHPPGGAIGPTRLTEAEANLAITRRLAALLRSAGARVTETRPTDEAVELGLRTVLAERAGAHLLISLHNNAFPDGVDPFASNGTTVFFNPPQSMGLARAVQRELLRELGLRDLGVTLADLALVRSTWMPSVLSETMFLMVPGQEAALRDPRVQERIARAHLRGIESFLRDESARAR